MKISNKAGFLAQTTQAGHVHSLKASIATILLTGLCSCSASWPLAPFILGQLGNLAGHPGFHRFRLSGLPSISLKAQPYCRLILAQLDL